jgi:membrane-associated protease RseP (regulator of RpoE activity)
LSTGAGRRSFALEGNEVQVVARVTGRKGWGAVGLLILALGLPARLAASTGEAGAVAVAALTSRAPEVGAVLVDAAVWIDQVLIEEEGETAARGAVVVSVERCSPAARAGLAPADAIVELDGDEVDATSDVTRILNARAPGARLDVTFVRDGKLHTAVLGVGPPTSPPRPTLVPPERCPQPLSAAGVPGGALASVAADALR